MELLVAVHTPNAQSAVIPTHYSIGGGVVPSRRRRNPVLLATDVQRGEGKAGAAVVVVAPPYFQFLHQENQASLLMRYPRQSSLRQVPSMPLSDQRTLAKVPPRKPVAGEADNMESVAVGVTSPQQSGWQELATQVQPPLPHLLLLWVYQQYNPVASVTPLARLLRERNGSGTSPMTAIETETAIAASRMDDSISGGLIPHGKSQVCPPNDLHHSKVCDHPPRPVWLWCVWEVSQAVSLLRQGEGTASTTHDTVFSPLHRRAVRADIASSQNLGHPSSDFGTPPMSALSADARGLSSWRQAIQEQQSTRTRSTVETPYHTKSSVDSDCMGQKAHSRWEHHGAIAQEMRQKTMNSYHLRRRVMVVVEVGYVFGAGRELVGP